MARMIPAHISEINNSAERRMAELLEHALPADVVVIQGRQILVDSASSGLMPREIDFIVIDPRQGILVIEVKGGELRYIPEEKRWTFVSADGQDVETRKMDPLNQTMNSMHLVRNLLDEKITGYKRKYRCGSSIAFPESVYTGTLPPNMNQTTLFDVRTCNIENFPDVLRAAYEKWHAEVTMLTITEMETIVNTLSPVYSIDVARSIRFEEYEKRIVLLTDDQREVIEGSLHTQRRVAIPGVAGSGKTLIARAMAEREAAAGKRVLFLCFNKSLAGWLAASPVTDDAAKGIVQYANYHAYVADLCRQYEIPWRAKSRELEFWTKYVPEQLFHIATNLLPYEEKYDSVIVDEGQDFHPNWWNSIEPLLRGQKDSQTLYVFYDPDQNIYQERTELPANLTSSFMLTTNCRNTKAIGQHCMQLIPTQMRMSRLSPPGDKPYMKQVASLQIAMQEAQEFVMHAIAETQRLEMSKIVILCIGVRGATIDRYSTQGGYTNDPLVWRANEGVLIADAGSFKGLESDVVILIDQDVRTTPEVAAKRYVAETRAKFELHVYEVR